MCTKGFQLGIVVKKEILLILFSCCDLLHYICKNFKIAKKYKIAIAYWH
jgi:hypothetical protein